MNGNIDTLISSPNQEGGQFYVQYRMVHGPSEGKLQTMKCDNYAEVMGIAIVGEVERVLEVVK